MEQYPDLKTATGIFIVSTLGIFAVLSGWMVILYRMGVRARHQRELQNHLQTISELLDRQEELTPDEPPSYEDPPDYETVIKVGMENEMREPHRRRRHHRRHRNHSCSGASGTISTVSANHTSVPIHNMEMPTTLAATQTHPGNIENLNIQEIASRVLQTTAACGNNPTTSKTESPNRKHKFACCNCNTMGLSTSPISISSGCELSSAHAEKNNYNTSSCATSTQYDECTDDFRDDSLNISLTLALPSTSQILNGSESNQFARPKSSVITNCNCTEQTYLKRSWIVVNNGNQKYKIQRLRHTFSSPETFPDDLQWEQMPEFISYGTNLPHDRSFYLSNTSNIVSELLPEMSSNSIGPHIDPLQTTIINATDDTFQCNDSYVHLLNSDITATHSDLPVFHIHTNKITGDATGRNSNHEDKVNPKQHLLLCEIDSDCENTISCFGAVNKPFRVNSRIRNQVGHKRSKSFTNTESDQYQLLNKSIKRSSSADLLMRFSPTSTTLASPKRDYFLHSKDQKIFLI